MTHRANRTTDTGEDEAVSIAQDEESADTLVNPGSEHDTDGHDPAPREETAIDADAELARLREELTSDAADAGDEGEPETDAPDDKAKPATSAEKPEKKDDADDDDDDSDESESERWHPSARRSRRRLLKQRAQLREELKQREERLASANQAFGVLNEACKNHGIHPSEISDALRVYADHKRGATQQQQQQVQEQKAPALDDRLQLLVDTGELSEDDALAIAESRQSKQRRTEQPQQQQQKPREEQREQHEQANPVQAVAAAVQREAEVMNAELEAVFGPDANEAGKRILAKARTKMRPDNMNAWPDILRIAAEVEIDAAKKRPRVTKTVPTARDSAGGNKSAAWKADLQELRNELVG